MRSLRADVQKSRRAPYASRQDASRVERDERRRSALVDAAFERRRRQLSLLLPGGGVRAKLREFAQRCATFSGAQRVFLLFAALIAARLFETIAESPLRKALLLRRVRPGEFLPLRVGASRTFAVVGRLQKFALERDLRYHSTKMCARLRGGDHETSKRASTSRKASFLLTHLLPHRTTVSRLLQTPAKVKMIARPPATAVAAVNGKAECATQTASLFVQLHVHKTPQRAKRAVGTQTTLEEASAQQQSSGYDGQPTMLVDFGVQYASLGYETAGDGVRQVLFRLANCAQSSSRPISAAFQPTIRRQCTSIPTTQPPIITRCRRPAWSTLERRPPSATLRFGAHTLRRHKTRRRTGCRPSTTTRRPTFRKQSPHKLARRHFRASPHHRTCKPTKAR